MEADLRSRQITEPPKEIDPEIQKARERFKNGETNANLRRLSIPWAPVLPEPSNNEVRRMLKYPRFFGGITMMTQVTLQQIQLMRATSIKHKKLLEVSKQSLCKRKPNVNDAINVVEKPMIDETVEETGKDEPMSLRKSVIMQMVDEEG